MKIVGEIKVKGFMRVEDLNEGDVFIFLDECDLYMMGRDEYDDTYVINLKTGMVTNIDETNQWLWADRPIERLIVK